MVRPNMLKILLPLGVGMFLLVSLVFFDGWPFRTAGKTGVGLNHAAPAVPPNPSASHEPVKESQPPPQEVEGDVDTWAAKLAQLEGKDPEAWRMALSKAVLDPKLPRDFRFAQLIKVRAVNQRLVFSDSPFSKAVTTKVRSGDNLSKIAARVRQQYGNNATPAFIMKMNGMTSDELRSGVQIKVPTGELSLVVRKDDFKLYVLLDGVVTLDYDIGTGKDGATPAGEFHISGKSKNPAWTMPDGKVVRYGDPEHIIGSRWLAFASQKGRTSFGIHGTTEERTVGQAASAGCIRMRKSDVEELFEMVPEGARVTLEP